MPADEALLKLDLVTFYSYTNLLKVSWDIYLKIKYAGLQRDQYILTANRLTAMKGFLL